MKIGLVSDLHLSVHPMDYPTPDVDVMVLAGDIWRPREAMAWAAAAPVPTLYVAGNHEFYGGDLATTMDALRAGAAGTRVRVLERSEWHHGGVRFLGCTLWSDYSLFASAQQREEGLRDAQTLMRDFSRIRIAPDFEDRFTPAVSQALFRESVAWLRERFAAGHDGKTVVITHFAPSPQSISPQFAGSALNACFVSDLSREIEAWQPALWVHGHTHDSFDYRVGATRVVCNPRGYAREGKLENPKFDPGLVLEI
ncbi:metallophosphoesterase family protein [Cupriavidus sp. 2TAF22]|uniref:metallophosphoesterase n=1 Tax=unclassified Cupriavidus TaxID=2640874 RepID=UPI003F8F15C3